MEREAKFNVLRGAIIGSYLGSESKKELIDFVGELEEAEKKLAEMGGE